MINLDILPVVIKKSITSNFEAKFIYNWVVFTFKKDYCDILTRLTLSVQSMRYLKLILEADNIKTGFNISGKNSGCTLCFQPLQKIPSVKYEFLDLSKNNF